MQHQRLPLQSLHQIYERLGQVKNISKGGLLFEYMADENYRNPVESELEIDIFISRDSFYLSKIPCKIIRDSQVVPNHSMITSIRMRQCGIQFKDLDLEAAHLLDALLHRCEPLH
ncbi:MAG: hypothetical protein DRH17_08755 [Deltaproteobacteria bacterium]|nr:MAG: hypothetical protein DRH17_08755 [Deltaproteobacteria bacterium]